MSWCVCNACNPALCELISPHSLSISALGCADETKVPLRQFNTGTTLWIKLKSNNGHSSFGASSLGAKSTKGPTHLQQRFKTRQRSQLVPMPNNCLSKLDKGTNDLYTVQSPVCLGCYMNPLLCNSPCTIPSMLPPSCTFYHKLFPLSLDNAIL